VQQTRKPRMGWTGLSLTLLLLTVNTSVADWPTFRADAARSGFRQGNLPQQASLAWKYAATHQPTPAWPRSKRMDFDQAMQPVIAKNTIFFGSTVSGIVHAVDLVTGVTRWEFATDGPIRFAPTVWQDRVFVASDDGILYALAIEDGRLLWQRRGGPDHESVLGNQRLVSKWPARGGPVVVEDTVYFAAGIWPSEGIYLYALDAATGDVQWVNNDSGALYMPQPHGGANAESGVSAQGYLVATSDRLLVPTGRAVPASFDRSTGKFEYFHLQRYGHRGGSLVMAVGDMFFNSGISFGAETGSELLKVGSGQLVATPKGLIRADGKTLAEFRWIEVEKPDRKGALVKSRALEQLWSLPAKVNVSSLIAVGDHVVVGGDGLVLVANRRSKTIEWSASINGNACGLAADNNRLVVSTDRGEIYCFSDAKVAIPQMIAENHNAILHHSGKTVAAVAAKAILDASGISAGYCVDLGCGDGQLALELARQSELRIIAVDSDQVNVQMTRKLLREAGLYGSRVTVIQRDHDATGLPPYIANLVVSGRTISRSEKLVPSDEARRVQRPSGGTICLGSADNLVVDRRDALAGAGDWTHQYADAGNTLCSDDSQVAGDLGMLWYRDFDFEVPQRHGRGPAPLYADGRLFNEGLDGVSAVDAYNGRQLWTYALKGLLRAYDGDELMGVAGTGSNYCLGSGSVFVRTDSRCVRIDAATGQLLAEYQTPKSTDGKHAPWGYIAHVDGVLYGTAADAEHVVTYRYVNRGGNMKQLLTESRTLFAIDVEAGKTIWQYQAKNSIRHNAIAITEGKVFVIDRAQADFDRVKKSQAEERVHKSGKLVALDAKSGDLLWEDDQDIYGTMLATSAKHGMLLMSYQPTRFRLDSEIGGRMSGFRTDGGQRVWEIKGDYRSRPLINDYTVYAEGGAWDLLTGESRPFDFKRSYGCGILAASEKMMLFRSATLGYYDLKTGGGKTENFGGVRPGCWVNMLPVGGLVLVPDASAGCQCSYLNRAWLALRPIQKSKSK